MVPDVSVPAFGRHYRLVEHIGQAHPCLDALFDSLDAACGEAQSWWAGCAGDLGDSCALGVEVSTRSGSWRTLRLMPCPGGCLLGGAQPGCGAADAAPLPSAAASGVGRDGLAGRDEPSPTQGSVG